jgi:hypothetical protein
VTDLYQLKCIDKCVRYRSALDETSLVDVNELGDLLLKSVGEDLGEDLQAAVL